MYAIPIILINVEINTMFTGLLIILLNVSITYGNLSAITKNRYSCRDANHYSKFRFFLFDGDRKNGSNNTNSILHYTHISKSFPYY